MLETTEQGKKKTQWFVPSLLYQEFGEPQQIETNQKEERPLWYSGCLEYSSKEEEKAGQKNKRKVFRDMGRGNYMQQCSKVVLGTPTQAVTWGSPAVPTNSTEQVTLETTLCFPGIIKKINAV